MAASTAGNLGKKTLLLEHTGSVGEKIRISGGGRCNFTNLNASYANYLSENIHFTKSPLARYSQHDFIKLVEKYKISYHEKTLGQLFCDGSSKQIIDMLIDECKLGNAEIILNCSVTEISKSDLFHISTNIKNFSCRSLIIATGGLSIPKLGASDFSYKIAQKFGLNIIQPRPALVPLILDKNTHEAFSSLSGISNFSDAHYSKIKFTENILFTHKGLSGPAILQISSFIKNPKGAIINLNLTPEHDLKKIFLSSSSAKITINNLLKSYFPKRFVELFLEINIIQPTKLIADFKKSELLSIASLLHFYPFKIQDTEGYIKAEVTAGGVDTNEFHSKTMESKKTPGLYFIGEAIDVTGWLGGYNFQWAWSSGFTAGMHA